VQRFKCTCRCSFTIVCKNNNAGICASTISCVQVELTQLGVYPVCAYFAKCACAPSECMNSSGMHVLRIYLPVAPGSKGVPSASASWVEDRNQVLGSLLSWEGGHTHPSSHADHSPSYQTWQGFKELFKIKTIGSFFPRYFARRSAG